MALHPRPSAPAVTGNSHTAPVTPVHGHRDCTCGRPFHDAADHARSCQVTAALQRARILHPAGRATRSQGLRGCGS